MNVRVLIAITAVACVMMVASVICKETLPQAAATPSCPNPWVCPNPEIPLHHPGVALCGGGIGDQLSSFQIQHGTTLCEDGSPTHVNIALYACGDNLAKALLGNDCVANHYWNLGTSAISGWGMAHVNTTVSATSSGTQLNVSPDPNIVNDVFLTIDAGSKQETVEATACPSTGCTNPITVTPSMSFTHSVGAHVIGAIVTCDDIASGNGVDPYDDRLRWLAGVAAGGLVQTPPPALEDTINPANSFVNHWNATTPGDGSAAVVQANEAFEPGNPCSAPSPSTAAGVIKAKLGNNLASQFYLAAITSELQGTGYPSISVDGIAVAATAYPWAAPGSQPFPSNPNLCPAGGCVEPSDHINEYPIIAWDRGFTVPQCLTGTTKQNVSDGGFIETDGKSGSNVLLTVDNVDSNGVIIDWDASRLSFISRLSHAPQPSSPPGKWIDGSSTLSGRPFLYIINGGDCQATTQLVFQSSMPLVSGNILAFNEEDAFEDPSSPSSCNAASPYLNEPKRHSGTAEFALNSASSFSSQQVAWQVETSCPQNATAGPAGGTSYQNNGGTAGTCKNSVHCAGGLDDVSLRYWVFGNMALFGDNRYVWTRHNFIGASGDDSHGLDTVGEDFFVFENPVVTVPPYVEGPPQFATGNGCTQNQLNSGTPGDSGGLTTGALHASGACVAVGDNGNTRFKSVPTAVVQQWTECYWAQSFVGPCAVIVNYSGATYTDSTTNYSNTFGNQGGELIPYSHVFSLNDVSNPNPGGAPAAGTGPCASSTTTQGPAAGGTGVSPCAQDVYEPGAGAVTGIPTNGPVLSNFEGVYGSVAAYTSEWTVNSGRDQTSTLNWCQQGFISNVLTVCSQEALILFR